MLLNLFIIITIFCWGIWGIFDKKALEEGSPYDVLLAMYAFSIPQIPLIYGLLNNSQPGWQLSQTTLLWSGLSGLAYALSMVAYLTALNKSEASYVLGITASYPLFMQLLAVIFLGESFVLARLIGAALMAAGIYAIGTSGKSQLSKLPAKDLPLMIVCIVTATLAWAIWGIFDKKTVDSASPLVSYFARILWNSVYLFVLAACFRLQGYRPRLANTRLWKFCGLSAAALALGAFSYFNALSQSTASYVIVITGSYPLLMYLFAIWFLKEKFSRDRLAGIALIVAGGILVQLTQSA